MIVFLDFDGVLHQPWVAASERFARLPLFESWLRRMPEVEVVISSSWRLTNTEDGLRSIFAEDLRSRIVGATPPGPDRSGSREHQIRTWLANEAPNRPWIAIDDTEWLFTHTERLVLCNPFFGLQVEDLAEADRLLAMPPRSTAIVETERTDAVIGECSFTQRGLPQRPDWADQSSPGTKEDERPDA